MSVSRVLLATLLLILVAQPAVASSKSTRAPLSGIKEVCVYLSPLSEDALDAGLSQENVSTVVELKLRSHGVKIFDGDMASAFLSGIPVVGLDFRAVRATNLPVIAMDATVSVLEAATVERLNASHAVVTWMASRIGVGGTTLFVDYSKSIIAELMDKLVNDILAARDDAAAEKPKKQLDTSAFDDILKGDKQ